MEYKGQPLHASASEAITNNVRVEVESQFVPDRSQPFEQLWHFMYTVRITNEGDDNVQLISRHWIITDATGHTQEVRGPGVVGEQPLLHPGESFQYTSNCELSTSTGVMKGTTAIARAPFGEGRVICFSPHPEKTAGLEGMITRAINWAAKR